MDLSQVDIKDLVTLDEFVEELQALRSVCAQPRERYRMRDILAFGKPMRITSGRLLASLIFMYPYHLAGMVPGPERLVTGTLDSNAIEDQVSGIIRDLYDHVDPMELSRSVADIMSELSDVAVEITTSVGTSISIKSLIEAAERVPRIWELLHWQIPDGLDFHDIERELERVGKEMVTCLKDAGGDFSRLLKSGAAINTDQMRQALVCVGPKPDLFGNVIPEPIDSSFLRGMRTVEEFYTCAVSARKALVTNFKHVKTSGYLSRKLVLLVAGHNLDASVADCGTAYPIPIQISSPEHAQRLIGRIFYNENGEEFLFDGAFDESMPSQTLYLRSPITCACKTGVCRKCYGQLSRINADIHAGIYGVLVISEQVTQRLLSSKHLLKTKTVKIDFPEEFLSVFSVERAAIVAESELERVEIRIEDMEEPEDDEEEVEQVSVVSFRRTGKKGSVRVQLPLPLKLDADAWEEADRKDGTITLQPYPGQTVFHVNVENSELSASLHNLFALIEKEEHTDVGELYSRFLGLLMESGIHSPSVHAEMIIRALVRDANDVTRRPDFAGEPDFTILKLPRAILTSESITNSLAFERVKEQLTDVLSLKKRSPGLFDPLFGGTSING